VNGPTFLGVCPIAQLRALEQLASLQTELMRNLDFLTSRMLMCAVFCHVSYVTQLDFFDSWQNQKRRDKPLAQFEKQPAPALDKLRRLHRAAVFHVWRHIEAD
jgi:hypothetical protein